MNQPVFVSIDRLNAKGRGVGVSSSIEIISALPGDELLVEVIGSKRGKRRGILKEVITPSPVRVTPRCGHVPLCGGCSWQQMRYEEQLAEKEKIVTRHFAPLLNQLHFTRRPILGCADPWRYRNKMEFSFSQNLVGERFLGLVIAGSRGHVFNLQECYLASSWFVAVLNSVKRWWEESALLAYRLNDTGTLRHITLREGTRTGHKMVILTVSGNPAYPITRTHLDRFVEAVRASSLDVKHLSIFLRVQQIKKGMETQFYEMHLFGPDHILEKLTVNGRDLYFKISPTSFFQPNSAQAEVLYAEALKMVAPCKRHVMDLYAGTATLGMVLGLQAERVTAIELNPHAIFDAESNQKLNGMTHMQLICGDVGKSLSLLKQQSNFIAPDLIVVDPPRSGLDLVALDQIKELQAEEIVYVSCNVATQVANIQALQQGGYEPILMQPIDQFPHTIHIENIVLLRKMNCFIPAS